LASDGGFDIQSLSSTGASTAPLSAATPGFHYDRFPACAFVPVRPAASAYTQTAASSRPADRRHIDLHPDCCPYGKGLYRRVLQRLDVTNTNAEDDP
jgi:hypothetical protein